MVGVLMVGANLALVLTWLNVKPKTESQTKKDYLAAALAALDRGNYSDAKRLAALTRDQRGISAAESSGASFVLGAATAMEADSMWDEDQRRYYLLAARHLEDARRGGFPKGREGKGLFLLGKSLCLSREYTASQAILERALQSQPAESNEIHRLLARAYLWGTRPDLKLALGHIEQYLADKQLSRREQFEGLLTKGQILFKDGKIDACLDVLKQIPKDSPSYADATVLQGQLLMRAAEKLQADAGDAPTAEARRAVQDKYAEAIDTLRKAQNRGNSAERIVPQSMYLIGQCFLAMNDPRSALDQFRRTQQGYPESIEGIAAAFQEADLLLRRLDQDDEAIAAYRRAVAAVGDPAEFRNPLLSLDNIRQRLSDADQTFAKAGRFEKAIQLTGVLFPLFTREKQIELAAEAHQAWAAALTHDVGRSSTVEGREAARQARAQLRQAGDAFSQLAALRLASRAYPEDVWNSADSYLAGHDFRGAVRMLEEYLRYELRRRRPRALLNLGTAQLALENFDRALEALNECIAAYASDAASYSARLLAAKAHVEKGEAKEAEKLLRENLEDGGLTPKSLEWRDSLFALGSLLEVEGRDEEAIPRLEEYVERYPDSPQLIDARYLIAEAYRRSARVPREKLDGDTIETSRIEHNKQMQQLLGAAIAQYEQVQDILTRRQEQTELEASDQAILRNCYFARGAAFYEMGRYDDAIRAYEAATNRYQHQPEVLDALMQIAACYRRLGRADEARHTLEQAKVMLTRISLDAPFTETTNYTRDQWSRILDWYASL
ncbi:MAG TPA: tetratricopeptide repeat protein [Pirellulales bacterium]|nr:tetratricopeptide repeat protein [Pirellulales bacterium]